MMKKSMGHSMNKNYKRQYEKVFRRDYKKKLALVKLKDYPIMFNSWIPIRDHVKDIWPHNTTKEVALDILGVE